MSTQEKQAVNYAAVNQNTYVESEVSDAFIAGAQFLDDLRKQSEPETNVGEDGKGVVPEIGAALMQPDKGLLEAAKDALRTFYGIGCNKEAEIVQVLTKAILNYEKQSK